MTTETTLPILTIPTVTVLEGDDGPATVEFVATLSAPSAIDVTFDLQTFTNNDDAFVASLGLDPQFPFTAVPDTDFVPGALAVTIPAGETSLTVQLDILGDTLFEGDEQIGLLASNLVGAETTAGADALISAITILNDDVQAPVTGSNALILDLEGGGRTVIQLDRDLAPQTVDRIVELADQGFYDGLIFHRVLEGFVAQGGDPNGDGTGGSGVTIPGEFSLADFDRGTVGLARGADPNSGDSQFFITFEDQPGLEGRFTVFGEVVDGLEVIDGLPLSPADGIVPDDPGVIANLESRQLTQFTAATYLDANPDLVAAGVTLETAAQHFIDIGAAEGRLISFDAQAYFDANPDLAAAGLTVADAHDHYLTFGRFEGRVLDFDAELYLRSNPDLVAAGVTPETALASFLDTGATETLSGRLVEFDDIAYLTANPDLADLGIFSFEDALEHYETIGQAEGRGFFDGELFFELNPELAVTGVLAEIDFDTTGRDAGLALPVRGGRGDDLLVGTAGDDFLRGDRGNDTLEGGDGIDTAVFDVNSTDFLITQSGDQIIATNTLGPDDVDTLIGIEQLRFADGTFAVADLLVS